MKSAKRITTLGLRKLRRITARQALTLVGIPALSLMLIGVVLDQDRQPDGEKPVDSISAGEETPLWMKPWLRKKAPMHLEEKRSNLWPRYLADDYVQDRKVAQQELIRLGFAGNEDTQFLASIAEADDAGHRELILRAGFTEQQVHNARERQREAYEQAESGQWFRQMLSIRAVAELRRQGFADFRGNVNVAAADDAGYGTLLALAGFAELQIRDARRRQREAREGAQADAWFRQLADIQKRQMDGKWSIPR